MSFVSQQDEESPSIKWEVLSQLQHFMAGSAALFRLLSQRSSPQAVAPWSADKVECLINKLVRTDKRLQMAISKTIAHQTFQNEHIDRLVSTLNERQADLMDLAIRLLTLERLLQATIDEVDADVSMIKQERASGRTPNLEDLVQTANRIANNSGIVAIVGASSSIQQISFDAPFPQDTAMRGSRIYDAYFDPVSAPTVPAEPEQAPEPALRLVEMIQSVGARAGGHGVAEAPKARFKLMFDDDDDDTSDSE